MKPLKLIRKVLIHPGLALGSTLLWGVLEFIALQRSYRVLMRERKIGNLTS